jgi:hypothetical protein
MRESFETIRDIPPIGFGLWKIDREICEAAFKRFHPIYD